MRETHRRRDREGNGNGDGTGVDRGCERKDRDGDGCRSRVDGGCGDRDSNGRAGEPGREGGGGLDAEEEAVDGAEDAGREHGAPRREEVQQCALRLGEACAAVRVDEEVVRVLREDGRVRVVHVLHDRVHQIEHRQAAVGGQLFWVSCVRKRLMKKCGNERENTDLEGADVDGLGNLRRVEAVLVGNHRERVDDGLRAERQVAQALRVLGDRLEPRALAPLLADIAPGVSPPSDAVHRSCTRAHSLSTEIVSQKKETRKKKRTNCQTNHLSPVTEFARASDLSSASTAFILLRSIQCLFPQRLFVHAAQSIKIAPFHSFDSFEHHRTLRVSVSRRAFSAW